jgi:hypothetical protein
MGVLGHTLVLKLLAAQHSDLSLWKSLNSDFLLFRFLIYSKIEKSKIRRLLQDLELIELHLQGRLYTRNNGQAHPTLVRIC